MTLPPALPYGKFLRIFRLAETMMVRIRDPVNTTAAVGSQPVREPLENSQIRTSDPQGARTHNLTVLCYAAIGIGTMMGPGEA